MVAPFSLLNSTLALITRLPAGRPRCRTECRRPWSSLHAVLPCANALHLAHVFAAHFGQLAMVLALMIWLGGMKAEQEGTAQ